jgi:hypothetical protein
MRPPRQLRTACLGQEASDRALLARSQLAISAESPLTFRTACGWTPSQGSHYRDAMAQRKLNMRHTIETLLRAVAAAGPVGWMALVTCAALALAAYAISAILTVVHALKG